MPQDLCVCWNIHHTFYSWQVFVWCEMSVDVSLSLSHTEWIVPRIELPSDVKLPSSKSRSARFTPLHSTPHYNRQMTLDYCHISVMVHLLVHYQHIQGVHLKSGPYFNMSNLFTKIYNMLYYTTCIYSKCWKWCPFISVHLSTCFTMFLATFLSVLSFTSSMAWWRLPSKFFKETMSTVGIRHRF